MLALLPEDPSELPPLEPSDLLSDLPSDFFSRALCCSEGLVPFEVATALLIVAVVGAIGLARSRALPAKPSARGEGETRRMFVGPVEDSSQSRSELEEAMR